MVKNEDKLSPELLAAIHKGTGLQPVAHSTYVTPETPKDTPLTSDFVIGVGNTLGWIGDKVTGVFGGTVFGRMMGIDGMKSYSDGPSNALKDLWVDAVDMPGFDGGVTSTSRFLELQLNKMQDRIVFQSPEDKQAFIAEFAAAISYEDQPDRLSYEMPDFVSHMSDVADRLKVQFVNGDGSIEYISGLSHTVPHLDPKAHSMAVLGETDGPRLVATQEPEEPKSEELVLGQEDHDDLNDPTQLDARNRNDEGVDEEVDGYDVSLSQLTPEPSLALEAFIHNLEDDGALEFTRLNPENNALVFGDTVSLASIKAELGTDTPDLRLMTDEQGTIYAVRLSNPDTGVEVYAEPESFLENTKLAFDAATPEVELNVLSEIFRSAAEHLPVPEVPEMALQNEGLPPPPVAMA